MKLTHKESVASEDGYDDDVDVPCPRCMRVAAWPLVEAPRSHAACACGHHVVSLHTGHALRPLNGRVLVRIPLRKAHGKWLSLPVTTVAHADDDGGGGGTTPLPWHGNSARLDPQQVETRLRRPSRWPVLAASAALLSVGLGVGVSYALVDLGSLADRVAGTVPWTALVKLLSELAATIVHPMMNATVVANDTQAIQVQVTYSLADLAM